MFYGSFFSLLSFAFKHENKKNDSLIDLYSEVGFIVDGLEKEDASLSRTRPHISGLVN